MLTQLTLLDQIFKRVAIKAVKLSYFKDYKLKWKIIQDIQG